MCGIAGFIDTQLSPNEASDLLSKMLHRIAHRGPDASSKWVEAPIALGHNRLSIVDLSENGLQPMHGFNSVIVFNGEIYNYLEIKADLIKLGYTFVSAQILKLYWLRTINGVKNVSADLLECGRLPYGIKRIASCSVLVTVLE
ncbi:MAG: hypothetical protein IPP51_06770 [Bacteroidetes bacterium]|nr:hypothetical protein [Bacteroidota bacterium]